jgi:transcriptional regulator with XRE-family HTH domain
MVRETIGARIRAFRTRKGWSMRLLAAQLGVNHVTVLRWEHGEIVPSYRRIEQLARAFKIAPSTLIPPQQRNTCTACRDKGGVMPS